MSIRILTKNGIDNTNIDGARDHNFNAGRRSGIVKGVLNEGKFFIITSNIVCLDSCELRLFGHRIVIEEAITHTLAGTPSTAVRYSFIAQVIVDDNFNVSFSTFIQLPSTELIQDNLDKTGKGTYQLEIGKFTQLSDGTLTDVTRTADLITGGDGSGDSEYIRIGTVTTNKISPELDADVDIENTINPDDNKPQTNFTFNLPTPSGTVVSLNGVEKTSINTDTTPTANSENLITSGGVHDYPAITFAESEYNKSKNLFNENKYLSSYCTYASNKWTTNSNRIGYNESILTNETGATDNRNTSKLPLLKKGTYTLTMFNAVNNTNDTTISIALYNQDGTINGTYTRATITTNTTITFTLASDLYLDIRVTGDVGTISFDHIQIEEGSTSTDYQPYYGAIVHQGDIATVVLYDKNSADPSINKGYTSGIMSDGVGNVKVSIDFSPYKKVKIYANLDRMNAVSEYDFTSGTDQFSILCGDLASSKSNVNYMSGYISKTEFRPVFAGLGGTAKDNNANYYVYRIEGIK